MSGHDFDEGDKVVSVLRGRQPGSRVFDDPETIQHRPGPNPHVGFGGPVHVSVSAPTSPRRRELSVVFRQLLTRLPGYRGGG